MKKVQKVVERAWTESVSWGKTFIVTVGTLMYYRFFRQNTLLPILHIVKCVQRGESNLELVKLLTNWRERKLYELHFIQVASTILAGAVVGCFSWVPASDGFWIGPALWYCALVLSIFAILLSSSQAFIFSALNHPTPGLNSSGDFRRYLALIVSTHGDDSPWIWQDSRPQVLSHCVPRWKMVFTWQAPMMLMSYAMLFFGVGLTVYVCTPLFNGEVTTPGGKISILYLAVGALGFTIFIYCSFYAYRFIDLDQIVEVDETPRTDTFPQPSVTASSIPLVSRKQPRSQSLSLQETA